jgi:hypothetical protein
VAEEASGNDLTKIIPCTGGGYSTIFVDVPCWPVVDFDDADIKGELVYAISYFGRETEERRDDLVAVPSSKYR